MLQFTINLKGKPKVENFDRRYVEIRTGDKMETRTLSVPNQEMKLDIDFGFNCSVVYWDYDVSGKKSEASETFHFQSNINSPLHSNGEIALTKVEDTSKPVPSVPSVPPVPPVPPVETTETPEQKLAHEARETQERIKAAGS